MNKLYVGNLSPSVTVEDLKQLFGERKLPVADQVLLKSGYAFVDFPDQNSAIKAIETLSGHTQGFGARLPKENRSRRNAINAHNNLYFGDSDSAGLYFAITRWNVWDGLMVRLILGEGGSSPIQALVLSGVIAGVTALLPSESHFRCTLLLTRHISLHLSERSAPNGHPRVWSPWKGGQLRRTAGGIAHAGRPPSLSHINTI
ncbi:insulin-like growth factor 2 mRNA-binding protein 2 isoform X1 [Lates japonicus]|uniref:Insulin-like growth factor 2 mRNA-binding protein 2 isoform X1 n=1 Tax=Lates japonicus TaxID=270547 RepID=A0AAD3MCH7_LATJO|nr:insulin-like growth factor 2 mRNA-binding protein 2 isoform X1 [Lates japonicus]